MTEPIDRIHETKSHLVEEIAVMLGGRAAEELVFNEMTTGASSDIDRASEVARAMVEKFGMSSLGPISFGQDQKSIYEQSTMSQDMASKIDIEVKTMIDEGYIVAQNVLKKLRDKLDVLAKELLVKETIESEDFIKLIGPKNAFAAVVAPTASAPRRRATK